MTVWFKPRSAKFARPKNCAPNFTKNKSKRDGLCSDCKECNKAKAKHWYESNSVKAKDSRKKYYDENRKISILRMAEYRQRNLDACKEVNRLWGEKNKDRKALLDKEWRKRNLDKARLDCRVSEQKRRAARLSSSGQYSARDVLRLRIIQKNKCVSCNRSLRDGFHIDHIIPLSKNGDNSKKNTQLLCPTCNMIKSAKHPIQFMREMGFLL